LIYLTIVRLISILFITISAQAYILPLDTILNKTIAHAGHQIIKVQQNVTFKEGSEEFTVQETWLIEGDKNLKLTATGTGALKGHFNILYLYNSKKRTHIASKNKIVQTVPAEFFERFLVTKSVDSYRTYLNEQGISSKVRLSRAGGAICFAVGEASTTAALSAQIWINQDFFHLNKIRFSTEADVEFLDYKNYGNTDSTVHYPTTKRVNWAGKSASIKVIQVSTKTAATIKDFYSDTLDTPSEISLADKGPLGQTVEEFYMRFR